MREDAFRLGEKHQRRGEHHKAVQQFTLFLEKCPKPTAQAYAARGASAQCLGNHVRAVYDFSMAIRLEPGEPGYFTARGVSFGLLHQLETEPGALNDHDTAVDLMSEVHGPPRELVAGVYLERGRCHQQAASIHRGTGSAEHAAKSRAQATAHLEQAVSDLSAGLDALTSHMVDPRESAEATPVLVERATCQRKLGKIDAALTDLYEAVQREPKIAPYRVEYAAALRASGQLTQSETELAEACRLRWDEANYRVQHSTSLFEVGRIEEASEELLVALELGHVEPVEFAVIVAPQPAQRFGLHLGRQVRSLDLLPVRLELVEPLDLREQLLHDRQDAILGVLHHVAGLLRGLLGGLCRPS